MRLRKIISAPERLEDDLDYGSPATTQDVTKPAMPKKLQQATKPFNPDLPPAAFPSLSVLLDQDARAGNVSASSQTVAMEMRQREDDATDRASTNEHGVRSLQEPVFPPDELSMPGMSDSDDTQAAAQSRVQDPVSTSSTSSSIQLQSAQS